MENERIIVGLDIGTTKICAIVGRKNEFGKLEVLGMGKAESEGVVKGIVFNIDKTVHAIEKAIKEASDQANIDIGVVNVGIAGQHIRSFIQHGGITRFKIVELAERVADRAIHTLQNRSVDARRQTNGDD